MSDSPIVSFELKPEHYQYKVPNKPDWYIELSNISNDLTQISARIKNALYAFDVTAR